MSGEQATRGLFPADHPHNPTRYERFWGVVLSAVLLLMAGAAIVIAAAGQGAPPGARIALDPNVPLAKTEFTDANLGARREGGVVVARLVAARFQFTPACFTVPAREPVELRLVSADVVHGVQITGTNANTMVVPGWVSVVTTTFEEGERMMPCHEFCGIGHNAMWARVVAVAPEAWREDLPCPLP